MNGGSHTNFNASSFTAGAFGGATVIANAMLAGIQNLRASRAADYATATANQLAHMLHFQNLKLADALEGWLGEMKKTQRLERRVAELELELKRADVNKCAA